LPWSLRFVTTLRTSSMGNGRDRMLEKVGGVLLGDPPNLIFWKSFELATPLLLRVGPASVGVLVVHFEKDALDADNVSHPAERVRVVEHAEPEVPFQHFARRQLGAVPDVS
jgi:hypothetical protein